MTGNAQRVGDIRFGFEHGYPFLYLIVGSEDNSQVGIRLYREYNVYVGECFGTKMGIDTVDPDDPACSTDLVLVGDIWTDTGLVAHIGEEEMDRILMEVNLKGVYDET